VKSKERRRLVLLSVHRYSSVRTLSIANDLITEKRPKFMVITRSLPLSSNSRFVLVIGPLGEQSSASFSTKCLSITNYPSRDPAVASIWTTFQLVLSVVHSSSAWHLRALVDTLNLLSFHSFSPFLPHPSSTTKNSSLQDTA